MSDPTRNVSGHRSVVMRPVLLAPRVPRSAATNQGAWYAALAFGSTSISVYEIGHRGALDRDDVRRRGRGARDRLRRAGLCGVWHRVGRRRHRGGESEHRANDRNRARFARHGGQRERLGFDDRGGFRPVLRADHRRSIVRVSRTVGALEPRDVDVGGDGVCGWEHGRRQPRRVGFRSGACPQCTSGCRQRHP